MQIIAMGQTPVKSGITKIDCAQVKANSLIFTNYVGRLPHDFSVSEIVEDQGFALASEFITAGYVNWVVMQPDAEWKE